MSGDSAMQYSNDAMNMDFVKTAHEYLLEKLSRIVQVGAEVPAWETPISQDLR